MTTVELMRDTDGPELVAALAEHGMKGELVDYDHHVAVRVDDCDDAELDARDRGLAAGARPAARPRPDRRLRLRGPAARRLAHID